MDDHTKDITQLAAAAGKAPRGVPHPMPVLRDLVYDFEHLGATLADSMVLAADDLMKEAHAIADRTRRLAVEIRTTVDEQSRLLADINARLKTTGEQMLEVARKFNST